jgi:hypothetical protein
MGVFPKLNHLDSHIDVELTDQIDWFLMSDADIVFMERPQTPNMRKGAHLVKDFGVKLWIDFDDNLFRLPDYNPNKSFFDSPTTKGCIVDCLKIADVVTVATESIKHEFEKYNKNIIVIPNAFNDYNYTLPKNPSLNKILQWRGSMTHRSDLLSCADEIFDVAARNEEWGWSFIGNELWYMTEFIKNSKALAEMPSIQYWKYIKNVNPAIQLVPLVFNTFNEGKSNISWIEGIYSGACAIAPDMPEWRKPGIETYRTPTEFKTKLDALVNDEKLRRDNFDLSLEYINDNLLLSKVNRKRIEVIEQLAGVACV